MEPEGKRGEGGRALLALLLVPLFVPFIFVASLLSALVFPPLVLAALLCIFLRTLSVKSLWVWVASFTGLGFFLFSALMYFGHPQRLPEDWIFTSDMAFASFTGGGFGFELWLYYWFSDRRDKSTKLKELEENEKGVL